MSVRGKNEGMLSQKGHDWDSRVNELGKEAAVYNTTHWESLLRLSLLGKLRVYLPTAYIRQSLLSRSQEIDKACGLGKPKLQNCFRKVRTVGGI